MKTSDKITWTASACVCIGAVAWIGGLLAITVHGRIGYPFDLEWMEGGMLLHAIRVQQGLPIYIDPTPQFIPYIYPPLYAWITGLLGEVFGVTYALGRWISVTGILVSAVLLIQAVRQEGASWILGLGAAALFLSTYEDAGAFFDLVRTDGLLMALTAGSLVASRRATRPALVAGGLLLVAAFATKHDTALFGLPIALTLWRHHGRRWAAWFAAWSVIPALVFLALIEIASSGRFLKYLVLAPASHPMVADRLFPGAEKEMFLAFPIAMVTAALAGAFLLVRPGPGSVRAPGAPPTRRWSWPRAYWTAVVCTGLGITILMRGHHGGFLNVLIPGFWLLALVFALLLGTIQRRFGGHPAIVLVASLVVAVQVWLERWEPSRYVPTDADRAAGQQVLDRIASYPGQVLMPHSPYYPVMVGKEPSFHLIALWDVSHEFTPFPEAEAMLEEAIRNQAWDAVILASPRFGHGLERSYRSAAAIRLPAKDFFPKTGWRARPRLVWEPRKDGFAPPTGPVEATTGDHREDEDDREEDGPEETP